MLQWLRDLLGEPLASDPFPAEWRAVIDAKVPLVAALGEDDRRELEGLVQRFLQTKHFEGAEGVVVDDAMRVVVAAQACMLLLHRQGDVFPDLDTVVIYPSSYVAPVRRREGYVTVEGEQARLGESWTRGVVVLAWDAVARDLAHPDDGHNVVLHEFAHQLDAEDGDVDGAPPLGHRSRYRAWARVLGEEYAELVARVDAHRPVDIDRYAATSPPEFFAVVTEMFFERPTALERRHPALYDELRQFFQQDPAALRRHARANALSSSEEAHGEGPPDR